MILIECPACNDPVAATLPLSDTLRCDGCAVAWDVTDPEPPGRLEDRRAA
jgi:hypothetical protein